MKKFFQIFSILHPLVDVDGLADFMLDKLEDFVEQTDNNIDDKLVLPAIKAIRIAIDVPADKKNELEVVK